MDASWVNLLRKGDPQAPSSPVRREILSRSPSRSRDELARNLRVSERTPQTRGPGLGGRRKGVKKASGIAASTSSGVVGLKARGARERQVQSGGDGRQVGSGPERLVNGTAEDYEMAQIRSELEAALRVNSEAQYRLEEQQVLINKLTDERDSLLQSSRRDHASSSTHSTEEMEFQLQGLRDALDEATREKRVLANELNVERERGLRAQSLEESLAQTSLSKSQLEEALSEKDEQIEGLMAHVKDLRAEVALFSSHMTPKANAHQHRHHTNNILIKDLERLALRNAELSEALSATRHSRSVLEREVVSLKRVLLEVKSRNEELEHSVLEATHDRQALEGRLRTAEDEGRRKMDELQQHVNMAMDSKAEQVREILDVSEQLQGSLSTLNREKDLLATSLRQEASYNKQLEEEKASLEQQLKETREHAKSMQADLRRLQEKQVTEIDAKCREIDRMKERLEGEVREMEVERGKVDSSLRRAERERDGANAQLERVRAEMKEMRAASGRLQDEKVSLQTELSRAQQEGAEREARFRSLSAELASAENRCAKLKKEVVEVREFETARARQQLESVSNRLLQSSKLLQQLEAERDSLSARVGDLEERLSHEQVERQSDLKKAEERLWQVTSDLDSALSDLEGTQTTKLLLQQKVSDLESEVSGLKEQLDSRVELTNEMKVLLDQRAARIRQLERSAESRSHDQLSANSSGLLNLTTGSEGEAPLMDSRCLLEPSSYLPSTAVGQRPPSPYGPTSSRSTTPVKFSSPGAEVVHLKQRLSESRQSCVRLEMQAAGLKTELAKLQGSLQAMVAIRDHLTEETTQLQHSNKCLKEERASLLHERDELASQLEAVRREMGSEVSQLQAERESLFGTCQELEGKLLELEGVCTGKDDELTSMEQLVRSTREMLETSEVAVHHLQRQVAIARQQVAVVQGEALQLREAVEVEAGLLMDETRQCSHEMTSLRAEATQVQETSRITEAVNRTRTEQIEEQEASVSRLLAEVEVLRARKAVVLRYLDSKEAGREAEEGGAELEALRETNRQLQGDLATAQRKLRELEDRHRNKVAELSAVLAERQALLLETQDALRANGLREEGDGVPSDCEAERAKPDRGRGEDGGRGGGRRKIERLRLKLKTQTKQTNYLRLRLGYTLSELRLYKRLKKEMDVRLDRVQQSMLTSQQQYQQCLERLQLAEQLGLASGCQ